MQFAGSVIELKNFDNPGLANWALNNPALVALRLLHDRSFTPKFKKYILPTLYKRKFGIDHSGMGVKGYAE